MKNESDRYQEIESEIKFIELLGYNIIETNNSNNYLITDTNNKEVGFIKKEKVHNENKEETSSDVFGYHMLIESDDIHYDCTRRLNDNAEKFTYEFDVKIPNNKRTGTHATMTINENVYLYIYGPGRSEIYWVMHQNQLLLHFTSKTDNYNIEEVVVAETGQDSITNKPYNSYYKYNLIFQPKDSNNKRITKNIALDVKYYDPNAVTISLARGSHFIIEDQISKGSIQEAITKHELGIEAFSHFRYLVNNILPFKKEVIKAMLEERGLNEPLFQLFIPDYKDLEKEDSTKKLCKK